MALSALVLIALGLNAFGLIAFGLIAFGLIAFGLIAFGLIALSDSRASIASPTRAPSGPTSTAQPAMKIGASVTTTTKPLHLLMESPCLDDGTCDPSNGVAYGEATSITNALAIW